MILSRTGSTSTYFAVFWRFDVFVSEVKITTDIVQHSFLDSKLESSVCIKAKLKRLTLAPRCSNWPPLHGLPYGHLPSIPSPPQFYCFSPPPTEWWNVIELWWWWWWWWKTIELWRWRNTWKVSSSFTACIHFRYSNNTFLSSFLYKGRARFLAFLAVVSC